MISVILGKWIIIKVLLDTFSTFSSLGTFKSTFPSKGGVISF